MDDRRCARSLPALHKNMAIAPPNAKAARTIAMISPVFMLSPAVVSRRVRVSFDLAPILRVEMRAGIVSSTCVMGGCQRLCHRGRGHRSIGRIWGYLRAPGVKPATVVIEGGNHDSRDRGHREDER